MAGEFTRGGHDVLIPDYRGYGRSPGRITSQQMLPAFLPVPGAGHNDLWAFEAYRAALDATLDPAGPRL